MKNRSLILKSDLENLTYSITKNYYCDLKVIKQEIIGKLNLLPTKDEFFTKMDKLMGELQAIREEQTLSAYRLSNHEDRISVLEQKVGVASI